MLEEKDNDINWYQTFSFTFLKDKAESEDDVLKATAEGSMLQVFEFGEMRVQHARCPRPSLFVQQHLNHISPHQIGVENDSTHLLTWAKKLNAQHVYEQDLLLMNTMGDMLVQL